MSSRTWPKNKGWEDISATEVEDGMNMSGEERNREKYSNWANKVEWHSYFDYPWFFCKGMVLGWLFIINAVNDF